jgi:uncharacterized protein
MPLMIELKVIPSAGRIAWILDKSGQLKCYLKSPPEKGKANAELIKLIAKAVGISQDRVIIVAGATDRKKRIKIEAAINFDQLLSFLSIDRQQGLFDH